MENSSPMVVSQQVDPLASLHLLVERVGPLSAGNDFNWWNLLILEPRKSDEEPYTSTTTRRRGCYGVYAAHGSGSVTYLNSNGDANGDPVPVGAGNNWSAPQTKRPGYFNIKIENTGNDVFVAFVLLAVDPGTTPFK